MLLSLNMFGVTAPIELHHSEKNTESTICDGCCDNKESHSNEEIKTLSVFVCEIQPLWKIYVDSAEQHKSYINM